MDTPDVIEEKIDLFVEALRDAYLVLRRQTRPESVGLGKRHEASLRRLASQLIHRFGDPRAYMMFLFDEAAKHGSDITYPRIIFSNNMLNKFFLSRPKRKAELELLARLQANKLDAYLANGRSLEEILRDTRIEMSAIFRFVSAHLGGLEELKEALREDAVMMLTYEPLYREIFGQWLPEDLK